MYADHSNFGLPRPLYLEEESRWRSPSWIPALCWPCNTKPKYLPRVLPSAKVGVVSFAALRDVSVETPFNWEFGFNLHIFIFILRELYTTNFLRSWRRQS